MLRCASWIGLLAVLTTVCPFGALPADDKKADDKKATDKKTWQEADLKKLAGRWPTVREEKTDQDTVRRRRMDLEFTEGELRVLVLDEEGREVRDNHIKVVGVEHAGRYGMASRVKFDHEEEVYYDFVGGKLILVGGIRRRPFVCQLSGEYKRAEKPK
jgi:hypothetical protein